MQVSVLTISEQFSDYAQAVKQLLERTSLRVELDTSREKIGYKIRQQTLKRVPFMLIIGAEEAKSGLVSIRLLNGKNQGSYTLENAIEYLTQASVAPDLKDADLLLKEAMSPLCD